MAIEIYTPSSLPNITDNPLIFGNPSYFGHNPEAITHIHGSETNTKENETPSYYPAIITIDIIGSTDKLTQDFFQGTQEIADINSDIISFIEWWNEIAIIETEIKNPPEDHHLDTYSDHTTNCTALADNTSDPTNVTYTNRLSSIYGHLHIIGLDGDKITVVGSREGISALGFYLNDNNNLRKIVEYNPYNPHSSSQTQSQLQWMNKIYTGQNDTDNTQHKDRLTSTKLITPDSDTLMQSDEMKKNTQTKYRNMGKDYNLTPLEYSFCENAKSNFEQYKNEKSINQEKAWEIKHIPDAISVFIPNHSDQNEEDTTSNLLKYLAALNGHVTISINQENGTLLIIDPLDMNPEFYTFDETLKALLKYSQETSKEIHIHQGSTYAINYKYNDAQGNLYVFSDHLSHGISSLVKNHKDPDTSTTPGVYASDKLVLGRHINTESTDNHKRKIIEVTPRKDDSIIEFLISNPQVINNDPLLYWLISNSEYLWGTQNGSIIDLMYYYLEFEKTHPNNDTLPSAIEPHLNQYIQFQWNQLGQKQSPHSRLKLTQIATILRKLNCPVTPDQVLAEILQYTKIDNEENDNENAIHNLVDDFMTLTQLGLLDYNDNNGMFSITYGFKNANIQEPEISSWDQIFQSAKQHSNHSIAQAIQEISTNNGTSFTITGWTTQKLNNLKNQLITISNSLKTPNFETIYQDIEKTLISLIDIIYHLKKAPIIADDSTSYINSLHLQIISKIKALNQYLSQNNNNQTKQIKLISLFAAYLEIAYDQPQYPALIADQMILLILSLPQEDDLRTDPRLLDKILSCILRTRNIDFLKTQLLQISNNPKTK